MKRMTLPLFLLTLMAFAVPLQAQNTDTPGVTTREVAYEQGGTPLVGYLAYPVTHDEADMVAASQSAVLVLPEWWGLTEYPKRRARELAAMGYVALAADLYGSGKTTDDPAQAKAWSGELYGDRDLFRARARAGLDQLAGMEVVNPEKVAVIGYCFGGTGVFELLYSGADLAAGVSFHGSPMPPREGGGGEAEAIKGEVQVHHGAADPMVTVEQLKNVLTPLEKAGVPWELCVYSGAKHAFTNPEADEKGMDAIGYDERADELSWAAMERLFERVLR